MNFFKYLILDSINIAIISFFLFFTYPQNFAQAEVYQPGTELNDAVGKANESAEGTGIMGMVEQFVGLGIAAAAISSLKFKYTQSSLIDCPQNENAKITLRLLQAGGLAYLLGEIKAKSEFKKASKLATDSAFAAKAKEDESTEEGQNTNNKQIEAYKTLIKVYDHKIKGTKTKKQLATLAELAYIGALGIEIVKTKSHKMKCEADAKLYATRRDAFIPNYNALAQAVTTNKESIQATGQCVDDTAAATATIPICSAHPMYVACETSEPEIEGLGQLIEGQGQLAAVEGVVEAIDAAGEDNDDEESIFKKFFTLKNIMLAVAVGGMLQSNNSQKINEPKFESSNVYVSNDYSKPKLKDPSFKEILKQLPEKIVREFIGIQDANAVIFLAPLAWGLGKVAIGFAVRRIAIRTAVAAARSPAVQQGLRNVATRATHLMRTGARTARTQSASTLAKKGAIELGSTVAIAAAIDVIVQPAEAEVVVEVVPPAEPPAPPPPPPGPTAAELAEIRAQEEAEARARLLAEQRLQAQLAREREIRTQREADLAAVAADTTICKAACNPGCANFQPTLTQYQELENTPIMCCGTELEEGLPTAKNRIPWPGKMDKKIDVEFQKLPLIGDSNIEKFLKPALLNMMEQKYFISYDSKNKSAQQILAEHKAFYEYLNFVEENFDAEFLNSSEIKNFDNQLAAIKDFSQSNYENFLGTLKSKILVQDATALDFSGVLGFGVKLFLIYKLTAKFFREKALNKPKNRMYTFGTIAAINALIVMFQGKRLKDNEKQRDIIQKELDKFTSSSNAITGIDAGDGENDENETSEDRVDRVGQNTESVNPEANDYSSDFPSCARQAGGSFEPAACPQEPIPGISNIPRRVFSSGEVSSASSFNSIPSLVSDATSAAASGVDQSNPRRFNDLLSAADRQLLAAKKDISKIAKDLDKTNPFILKDSKGKPFLLGSLNRSLANIRKSYKNPSKTSASDVEFSATSKKELEEKLNLPSSSGINTPSSASSAPAYGGSSSGGYVDIYSDGAGGVIEDFAAYEEDIDYTAKSELNIKTEDIINKPDVSIFKIISSRYLKNYNTLLERDEVEKSK